MLMEGSDGTAWRRSGGGLFLKGEHITNLIVVQVTQLCSDVLAFLRYYFHLRRDVLLGRHQTSRPLGMWWRWKNWQYNQQVKQRQQTQGNRAQDDVEAVPAVAIKDLGAINHNSHI